MSAVNTEKLAMLLDNLDQAMESGMSIEQLTDVARQIVTKWKAERDVEPPCSEVYMASPQHEPEATTKKVSLALGRKKQSTDS